ALPPQVPFIGFAGAPFTLASYAIEGGATRGFTLTKRFMYSEPRAWHELMQRFAELVGGYLAAQARAGAGALQLFDSWVGCLSPADYATYVFPHSQRALELAGASGVPVIHFGTDTATLLVAYGGPENLDEVEPYLRDVRGGRPTAPEFVEEIRQRYARIGGRSPIRELTEAQAAGVRRALDERFAVYVGMRHWHPYIRDV